MKTQWKPETYGDYLLLSEWRSIVKSGRAPYIPPGYGLFIGGDGKPQLRTVGLNITQARTGKLPDQIDWGRFVINPEKQSA